MNIEQKLLALMEDTNAKNLSEVTSPLAGTKFIIAHPKTGGDPVVVSGPYGMEDDTKKDEGSFVDHPDYSKIETKSYEDCKNCDWFHGGKLTEAKKESKEPKEGEKGSDEKKTGQADSVEGAPAVSIENPLDPSLAPSGDKQVKTEEKMGMACNKKLYEALVEAKKEGKVTSDWTAFSDADWQGFAGASPISADRQPEIMSHGDWAVVHSGTEGIPGHSEVRAMYFHSDPGEHPQHLPNSFEGQHVTLASGQTPHVDALMKDTKALASMLDALHGKKNDADNHEKIAKFISENKSDLTENFEPFTKQDWYGWNGAEKFANGDQPKIMQHGPWTVIAQGDFDMNKHPGNDHSEIHAYHDDIADEDNLHGIHGLHRDDIVKVFAGPRKHAEAIMKNPSLIKGMLDTVHQAHYGNSRPYEGAKINLVEPHVVNKLSEQKIEEFLQQEELSEEFQLKASTLFVAKLNEAVEAKTSTLQEEFRVKLEEAVASSEQGLIEKIDGYFEVLSEKWMQDNEVALEATIRSELTESFVEGLLGLCKQHSIDLPIEKRDVVKTLEEELKEAKTKLTEAQEALNEQTSELNSATREIVLEEMTKGMTMMDSNKFKTIMEDFDFESKDNFVSRCEVIKESFFAKTDTKKLDVSKTALVEDTNRKTPGKPSSVSVYATYIKSKTMKQ